MKLLQNCATIRPRKRGGIPVHFRVVIALQYLSGGSYQWTIAQNMDHPTTASSVSKILHKFLNAIVEIKNLFIGFPVSQERRRSVTSRLLLTAKCNKFNCLQLLFFRFKKVSGLPNILSLIDGTFIPIVIPSSNEEAYYSESKQNHGINFQIVFYFNK